MISARLLLMPALILGACTAVDDGEECGPSTTRVAVIGLADVLNRELDPFTADADGYRPATSPAPDAPVAVRDYLLSVSAGTVVAEDRRATGPDWLGLLVSSVEADCIGPTLAAVQDLAELELVSDAALSPELPPGASLADVSKVFVGEAYDLGPDGIPPVYGSPALDALPTLDELVASTPAAPLSFGVLLDTDTDASRVHRFTLTYALDTGEVFVATSDPVTLVPTPEALPAGLTPPGERMRVWTSGSIAATLYLLTPVEVAGSNATPVSPLAAIERSTASTSVIGFLESEPATRHSETGLPACAPTDTTPRFYLDVAYRSGERLLYAEPDACTPGPGSSLGGPIVADVSRASFCELATLEPFLGLELPRTCP